MMKYENDLELNENKTNQLDEVLKYFDEFTTTQKSKLIDDTSKYAKKDNIFSGLQDLGNVLNKNIIEIIIFLIGLKFNNLNKNLTDNTRQFNLTNTILDIINFLQILAYLIQKNKNNEK
jgi:hypothetical protein